MTADRRRYLCFSADTSPDLARARFGERFGGAAPEKVYVQAGMLWAGPVPGQESETMSTYVPFEKWSRVLPKYAHLYTAKEKASIRRNGGHVPQAPDAPDTAAGQSPLFDDTTCLPLFSGTPVPGRLEVFAPPASQVQAKLPGFELKLKGE